MSSSVIKNIHQNDLRSFAATVASSASSSLASSKPLQSKPSLASQQQHQPQLSGNQTKSQLNQAKHHSQPDPFRAFDKFRRTPPSQDSDNKSQRRDLQNQSQQKSSSQRGDLNNKKALYIKTESHRANFIGMEWVMSDSEKFLKKITVVKSPDSPSDDGFTSPIEELFEDLDSFSSFESLEY